VIGLLSILSVLTQLVSPISVWSAPKLAHKSPVPSELFHYLRIPQPSFKFTESRPSDGEIDFQISTQIWHGTAWNQSLIVQGLKTEDRATRFGPFNHAAILYLTGDNPDKADIDDAKHLSEISNLPVATLFNVPVQPVFGLQEDDLIAYTFQQYLKTGDATWPLLFPMVKGARQAMNVLQTATHQQINRFIILGESKRGWTAWLAAGTGDHRMIGVAPASIDFLNIPAQLDHQKKLWGHVSPMFQPYVARGLLSESSSVRFNRLVRMVDPYSYLRNIKIPVLVVRGTNDPFWPVDAHNFYASRLSRRNWILNLPNEGHDFKNQNLFFEDIAAFARMCVLDQRKRQLLKWPIVWAKIVRHQLVVHSSVRPTGVRLYRAYNDSADFSKSTWSLAGQVSPKLSGRRFVYHLDFPKTKIGYGAWFLSLDFSLLEGETPTNFTVCTPIQIEFPPPNHK